MVAAYHASTFCDYLCRMLFKMDYQRHLICAACSTLKVAGRQLVSGAESRSNGFCGAGLHSGNRDAPQDPWQPWQSTSEGLYALYQLLKLISVKQLAVCLSLSVCGSSFLVSLVIQSLCPFEHLWGFKAVPCLSFCVSSFLPFPSHLVVPIPFF